MSDLEKRDRSTMREGIMELKNKRRCQYFIEKETVTSMEAEAKRKGEEENGVLRKVLVTKGIFLGKEMELNPKNSSHVFF